MLLADEDVARVFAGRVNGHPARIVDGVQVVVRGQGSHVARRTRVIGVVATIAGGNRHVLAVVEAIAADQRRQAHPRVVADTGGEGDHGAVALGNVAGIILDADERVGVFLQILGRHRHQRVEVVVVGHPPADHVRLIGVGGHFRGQRTLDRRGHVAGIDLIIADVAQQQLIGLRRATTQGRRIGDGNLVLRRQRLHPGVIAQRRIAVAAPRFIAVVGVDLQRRLTRIGLGIRGRRLLLVIPFQHRSLGQRQTSVHHPRLEVDVARQHHARGVGRGVRRPLDPDQRVHAAGERHAHQCHAQGHEEDADDHALDRLAPVEAAQKQPADNGERQHQRDHHEPTEVQRGAIEHRDEVAHLRKGPVVVAGALSDAAGPPRIQLLVEALQQVMERIEEVQDRDDTIENNVDKAGEHEGSQHHHARDHLHTLDTGLRRRVQAQRIQHRAEKHRLVHAGIDPVGAGDPLALADLGAGLVRIMAHRHRRVIRGLAEQPAVVLVVRRVGVANKRSGGAAAAAGLFTR